MDDLTMQLMQLITRQFKQPKVSKRITNTIIFKSITLLAPSLRPCLLGVGAAMAGAMAMAPSASWAHGVETNFTALQASGLIELRTQFSSGEPLADAEVRLQSPDGSKTLKLGRTGSDGRFSAQLPAQASRQWELVIDGGPGHRDYLELNGPRASQQRSWAHWLIGLGVLGGTLAMTGCLSHGQQRQHRP